MLKAVQHEEVMGYNFIDFDIHGDVATITLARPRKLNAITPAMADEISHALANYGKARAILIRGEGRAFCAGADLANIDDMEPHEVLTKHFNPLILALTDHRLPIVAEVNGAAAGFGCSLALACDFVIAGEGGYFLQPLLNLGLVPDGGANWIVPRLIGRARAAEMLMLGEKIHGPQALDWGMIHRCVPENMLEHESFALAARLARGPTKSIGMTKAILAAFDRDLETILEAEAKAQRLAGKSADVKEGIGAFLEKRKPKFKGK